MDKLHLGIYIPVLLCILPSYGSGDTMVLSLEEALRRADEHSIDLQSGEAELRAAHSAYSLGLRSFFPSISFSYSGNRGVTRGGTDSKEHQASLHFNQLLFNGGKRLRERRVHRKQMLLQSSELSAKRDSLRDAVWKAYQEIAMLRERYKLQDSSLQLAGELMQIIEMKFSQGSITELDHIQGLITLQETEQNLEETKLDLHLKEFFFLTLLGLPPETEFALEGETFIDYNGMIIPFGLENLYRIALENNRELQRSEFAIQQQEAAGRHLGRCSFPALSLEGTISFSGASFPLSSPVYSLSLSVQLPESLSPSVLSIGMRHASMQKSPPSTRALSGSFSISPWENTGVFLSSRQHEAGLISLKIEHRQRIDALRHSIREALDRHQLLVRQLSLFRRTLALRRREYDLLKLKWNLGEALQSQVVEAHAGLASREIELLKKILDVKLAERELEHMAGLPPGAFSRASEGGQL